MKTSSPLFVPSSTLLLTMIQRAEAKFEAAREQAALRKEAEDNARYARGVEAEVKARYYAAIQLGRR